MHYRKKNLKFRLRPSPEKNSGSASVPSDWANSCGLAFTSLHIRSFHVVFLQDTEDAI